MRFDRIRLEQFKCYTDADLQLDAGVTVIHGVNGSGKSSLLEACFFALYGAKALDKTLADVVTIGSDEATVELWFTHDGASYHIERRVRVGDDGARTATCVLEAPDRTVEGATAVRTFVTELLRMDTEAFVNCAYVRQGEVNKLINASPSDRQDMLDDLLQLGKLEEYRERASDARVGVGRVRDDKQGALSEVEEQIATKESKDLQAQRNEYESRLADLRERIENYEGNRAEAETTLEEAEAILEEYAEKQSELEAVGSDIEALRERIQATEREREELSDRIEACREDRAEARERRDELVDTLDGIDPAVDEEGVAEALSSAAADIEDVTERLRELSVEKQEYDGEEERRREQGETLAETATEKREEADSLEADVADAADLLARKREKLTAIEDETADLQESFADEPVDPGETETYRDAVAEDLADVREQLAETEAECSNARERVAEAERLEEAGKCPECGQPVDESPHVDALAQRRERVTELESELSALREREATLEARLETAERLVERDERLEELRTERETLEQLLDQHETSIAEKRERIDTLREEAATKEREAAKAREKASAAAERAAERQEQIATKNSEKATLGKRNDRLEELDAVLSEIATLTADIETLQEKRAEKAEINDERRERLAEKRDRRAELADAFDEGRIETARTERERASEYIEKVEAELANLEDERDELQAALGAVENELEELSALRERREALAATVDRLETLYQEVETLEETYATLRAQLRRQNVETLERMLNETFDLVYENDTYSRIELDGEYRLTVYQKDGETLDPDQLSGGERALFNLSLRCAIYRLLAEGIEGTAPMPPLILDEPTVFLDEGHVGKLVELVEAMRDLGVEQILVVSHDEELVAAADDVVTVRKDPTTNRSTVERTDAVDPQVLEADD
ncbi:MAG: DNA double-strand break repair ATPase Rad50 [Halovenus sp.]